MSKRYFLYDDRTDQFAEFGTMNTFKLMEAMGKTAKGKAGRGLAIAGLGAAGVAGAAGYGAYRGGKALLNRRKAKKEAGSPTSRAGRLKARIMALKAQGSSKLSDLKSGTKAQVANVKSKMNRKGA